LLVPKKALSGLSDLNQNDAGFLIDLYSTVQDLVKELRLEPVGYRLIVNGGSYQDVPHLHFHLVSGSGKINSNSESKAPIPSSDVFTA
jgi:diadenosine tetraphosphate (Ap4A) HIT family hydrolase